MKDITLFENQFKKLMDKYESEEDMMDDLPNLIVYLQELREDMKENERPHLV